MAVDLIFTRAPHAGGPVDLLFGATTGPTLVPITVTGTGVLGGPVGSGAVQIVPHPVAVAGVSVLGGVSAYGVAAYDNRNPRRASTIAHTPHQVAARALGATTGAWGNTQRELGQTASAWTPAAPAVTEPRAAWITAARIERGDVVAWARAQARAVQAAAVHQSAAPRAASHRAPWGLGSPVVGQSALTHQSGHPVRAAALAAWLTSATPVQALAVGHYGFGTPRAAGLLALWQTGQPMPPGMEMWPPADPGVTPPRVPSPHLLFACPPAWLGSGSVHLLFGRVCGGPEHPTGTVVVPIRSVYMTINNFSLIRLDNGFPIPATALSLSLDADSWTWNCSFSVRGDVLPFVEPNVAGDPVVAQATVNGTPIRFIIEKIGRERTFGVSQLRCSGRGISAALDAPYSPVQSFNNSAARTVRQLLDDILTLNGASIGWTVDRFDLTDWLVPASVFSYTGTYISALNAVVGTVGAYIQPKDTTDVLDVLLRYPTPAWEWSSAIPDLILPSAVTSREGIEWVDKPVYDRVFVSGQQGGVSGRYTRTGTAGEMLAPAVVDPLITHADAVRQRGRAVISDTGRIANVTLRLPVLSETGIIRPGTMVEYADGAVTRKGLTRSVAVDVALPTIYQTVEVETHVE